MPMIDWTADEAEEVWKIIIDEQEPPQVERPQESAAD
jgi:hypothetical protein